MFGNPSLMTRIAIGKLIGFVFGLAGFFRKPCQRRLPGPGGEKLLSYRAGLSGTFTH